METTGSDPFDLLVLKPFDYRRQFGVLGIPMAALAFVIGCTTAAPSVNDTELVESH